VSYTVDILTPAQKSLCRLTTNIQSRIGRSMLALENNPRPSNVVKLSGREGWRIRVGDYRILYTIDDAKKEVVIYAIGHRREIYR
jgi:mRNA interferase RelE/StbE